MAFQESSKSYLNYINGTITWTAFVPLSPIEPAIFCLNLNEALSSAVEKSAIASSVKTGSSL